MENKGLFWSAMVRAILSLRRDTQTQTEDDSYAFTLLERLEAGNLNEAALASLISRLTPPELLPVIGRSLIGYLDFNKMGTLIMFLTASKNVAEMFEALRQFQNKLFRSDAGFDFCTDSEQTTVTWKPSQFVELEALFAYFLLSVARHLAGRKFDFIHIKLPDSKTTELLFTNLSSATMLDAETVTLTFASSWMKTPSFYHSAQLKSVLSSSLNIQPVLSTLQRIEAIFEKSPNPARIRLENVAQSLGRSESALRKELKQEDISFSRALKNYIHDRACQLLLAGEKTENVATTLGFSDRRSFDRSFKEHSGINAGQVRQLGNRLRFQKGNTHLLDIVEHLPPLPDTVSQLLALDDDKMSLSQVVSIIETDPIFHAHVMGKASRASFGRTPDSLEQAIGRNLGLGNIKNIAVIFSAQQLLTAQSRFRDVTLLTDAMLLSDRVYTDTFGQPEDNAESIQTRQLLLFGLLSLLIVFHSDCLYVEGALQHWEQADNFAQFAQDIKTNYGICLYGATSLMLLRWGFTSNINQQLWKLCHAGNDTRITPQQYRIVATHDLTVTALFFGKAHADVQLNKYTALPEAEQEAMRALLAGL